MNWIEIAGPERALKLFGITLVGISAQNGKKLLFTLVFVAVVLLLNAAVRAVFLRLADYLGKRAVFWTRQGMRLFFAMVMVLGVLSIWFDQPGRLATALGLVTAGLAFALQRVVTAFAAYLLILRGKMFNVGDRITMGGVRGDVIGLGFLQTTIMEMGQPPAVQNADPAMWVKARQYTGRIVSVSNDQVFQTPVYNYSREFPYIWEEMSIPVPFDADRAVAEAILLKAAQQHATTASEIVDEDLHELERRYFVRREELGPRVYWRITDNWLELTVRFLTTTHGVRDIKDAMAREILPAFDKRGIQVASTTFALVQAPPLKVELGQELK